MNREIARISMIVGTLSLLGGCAAPGPSGLQPSKNEFDSQWVEITIGTAIGERGGQPALLLTLKNKTDSAVWVKVGFASPDPNQNCASAKQLAPKGVATYTCPQKELVADVDYPILVATFSDEALTRNLETKQTKMQFRAQDIAHLKTWMTPPKLPATFTDVWYRTEEAQVMIAYKEKGTLVVSADKLQFTHSNGIVEIPISAITNVVPQKKLPIDIANTWVAVEHRAAGKDAIAAFKYSPFSGKPSDEIFSAISWAREKK